MSSRWKTNTATCAGVLALSLTLTACDALNAAYRAMPAPVTLLGLKPESATGAMTVLEGDTVWQISQRYRLPVREIIDINHLAPPYTLSVGQRLMLPAPVDYKIRWNDTLETIADMFGVSLSQLVKVNGLSEPHRITIGQTLRIPSSHQPLNATETEEAPQIVAPVVVPEVVVSEVLPPPPTTTTAPTVTAAAVPPAPQHRKPVTTLAPVKTTGFMWPLRGKVVSDFGAKDGGLFNDGINIAAPKGTPVAAAAEGTVAYVGSAMKGYGNLVLLRHSGGTMTAYAHLNTVSVRKGQTLRKGQSLGTVGASGSVESTQLHFEIRHGAKALNPRKYLG